MFSFSPAPCLPPPFLHVASRLSLRTAFGYRAVDSGAGIHPPCGVECRAMTPERKREEGYGGAEHSSFVLRLCGLSGRFLLVKEEFSGGLFAPGLGLVFTQMCVFVAGGRSNASRSCKTSCSSTRGFNCCSTVVVQLMIIQTALRREPVVYFFANARMTALARAVKCATSLTEAHS